MSLQQQQLSGDCTSRGKQGGSSLSTVSQQQHHKAVAAAMDLHGQAGDTASRIVAAALAVTAVAGFTCFALV